MSDNLSEISSVSDSPVVEKSVEAEIKSTPSPAKPLARRRRLNKLKNVINTGVLLVVAARGSVALGQDIGNSLSAAGAYKNNSTPVTLESKTPVPEISIAVPDTGQQQYEINTYDANVADVEEQKTIEDKYGVKLVSMQHAYEELGSKFDKDDPKIVGANPNPRWTFNQMDILATTLEGLPRDMYEGRIFFLADFGTDFSPAAASFGDNIIGIQYTCLDPDKDADGARSLLVHELTHTNKTANTPEFKAKIEAILGNKSYLKLKEFDTPNIDFEHLYKLSIGDQSNGYTDTMAEAGAIGTLQSFAPDGSFPEGIAGLSQLYIRGPNHFLLALGPLLDGQGFDSANKKAQGNLQKLYPKAYQLYLLYKSNVFEEYEYPDYFADFTDKDKVTNLETKYNIIVKGSLYYNAPDEDLDLLDTFLQDTPRSLLERSDGSKPEIDITDFWGIAIGDRTQLFTNDLKNFRSDTQARIGVFEQLVSNKIMFDKIDMSPSLKAILGEDFLNHNLNTTINYSDSAIKDYINDTFSYNPKFSNDWGNLSRKLATLYSQGWDVFSKISAFTDPNGGDQKARQLYQLMGKSVYGGWEKPSS